MKQKQDVIKNKVHLENKELLDIKNMTAEMKKSILGNKFEMI